MSRCKPVDLTAAAGSMAEVPVRTQLRLGICFAYPPLVAIEALIRSAGKPVALRPSPLEAAIGAAEVEGRVTTLEEGGSCSVFNYVRDHGYCVEGREGFPKDVDIGTATWKLEEWLGRWRGQASSRPEHVAAELEAFLEEHAISPPRSMRASVVSELAQGKYAPMTYLRQLLVPACRAGRVKVPHLRDWSCRGRGLGDAPVDSLLSHVHDLLDRDTPQPVMLAMCEAVLDWPGASEGRVKGLDEWGNAKGDNQCGPHVVLAVGRRWHVPPGKPASEGRCQLLIRNSKGFRPEAHQRAGWEVKGTDPWVDVSAIRENLYFVEWLERQGTE